VETERDRARDFCAREESQGLRVDDRQERGLGVLRRSDREEHTVIFTVALRSRDEERLTEDQPVVAEPRRRARLDVDLDDRRSVRTAGLVAVGRSIGEAP